MLTLIPHTDHTTPHEKNKNNKCCQDKVSDGEYSGLFNVITDYVYALDTLDRYDFQSLQIKSKRVRHAGIPSYVIPFLLSVISFVVLLFHQLAITAFLDLCVAKSASLVDFIF